MTKFLFVLTVLSCFYLPSKSYAFDLSEVNPLTLVFGEESKCQKLEWVKSAGRTQGDGWIWFTGKGMADDISEAYLKAEGMAVTRMIQECVIPHKEAKIHERCDEKIGGHYSAYARISLKSGKCREAKYSKGEFRGVITNSELQKIYSKYQKELGVSVDTKEARTPKEHYKVGKYFFFLDDYDKAFYHFDFSCREGLMKSCYNAGLVMFQRENYVDAKKYFSMSCKDKNYASCYFLGRVYSNQVNHDKANRFYAEACRGDDAKGCHALSHYYFKHEQRTLAKKFAKKACYLDLGKGCYNYALISSNKKQARYYKKACDLGMADGCTKYASILYSQGKKKKSLGYAEKACHIGSYKACHNAGYIYNQRKNRTRALEFFQIACSNHFEPSCGWVERLDR